MKININIFYNLIINSFIYLILKIDKFKKNK